MYATRAWVSPSWAAAVIESWRLPAVALSVPLGAPLKLMLAFCTSKPASLSFDS